MRTGGERLGARETGAAESGSGVECGSNVRLERTARVAHCHNLVRRRNLAARLCEQKSSSHDAKARAHQVAVAGSDESAQFGALGIDRRARCRSSAAQLGHRARLARQRNLCLQRLWATRARVL